MPSSTTRPRAGRLAILLLVVVALLVAACGGGDDDTGGPSPADSSDDGGGTATEEYSLVERDCGARGAEGSIENLLDRAAAFSISVTFQYEDGRVYGTSSAKTSVLEPGATVGWGADVPPGHNGVPAKCVITASAQEEAEEVTLEDVGTVNFVVAGGASEVAQLVLVSNDGKEWFLLDALDRAVGQIRDIDHHDGVWVAVTSTGAVLRSEDGIEWETTFTASDNLLTSRVFYQDGSWVVQPSGKQNTVPIYSSDGRTWTPGEWTPYDWSGGGIVGPRAENSAGTRLAIVRGWTRGSPTTGASNQPALVDITTAGQYAQIDNVTDPTKPRFVGSVYYADGTFVVTTGDDNREIALSTDGATWTFPATERTEEYETLKDLESHDPVEVSFHDGTWVAVTGDGQIFTATDPTSWEFLDWRTPIPTTLNGIGFSAIASTD